MADFFDYDPLSGALETIDYDFNTKSIIIKRTHTNVDAVMDAAEVIRNDPGEAWRGADDTQWHVGTVPEYIWNVWPRKPRRWRRRGGPESWPSTGAKRDSNGCPGRA